MQRTERLLALIQILRRNRRPVTAETIAQEFEVSVRTVYRDILQMQSTGVPIRGEAGLGYVLDPGFDLPPLMFSADELEALMLGARFVEERADPGLVRAAQDAVAKILAVLPPALKPVFTEAPVIATAIRRTAPDRVDIGLVRRALRTNTKLDLDYVDEQGRATRRTVWPITLAYVEASRMLVAFCELRQDFRSFRTDRIQAIGERTDRYPARRAVLLRRWQQEREAERAACAGGTGLARRTDAAAE